MIFYGLDKDNIIASSVYENGYFRYKLGNKIEVTSPKKKHVNNILAKSLSFETNEDKMMIKYYPSNEILFKEDFLKDKNANNFSSCLISKESCSVCVGKTEDFPITSGILAFSGVLSLNNKVQSNRIILCNSQMDDYARKKIRILACGLRDDKLFALFYIPSERGLALSCDEGGMSISAKSLMFKSYKNWDTFTIDDWFDGVKIKEI